MRAPLIVTTSGKLFRRAEVDAAQVLARTLGVPYVPRGRDIPIETLLEGAEAILALRGDGVALIDADGETRWNGGMAELRLRRIDDGIQQPDHVLVSGEVRPGDHVIDCTLGRGQDALVLARAVGPGGRVIGCEKSLPLYAWVSTGLALRGPSKNACEIECRLGDAMQVLQQLPSQSADVVYFDPMFDKRAFSEGGFSIVRRYGVKQPLDEAVIAEARRVARRWVVVKTAPQSTELRRLGLTLLPFRRSADLRFGRIAGGLG